MKITKLIKAESTIDELVFETDPPVTPEIVAACNAGDTFGIALLRERNGKLVILHSQFRDLRMDQGSKKPVEYLSERLTANERYVQVGGWDETRAAGLLADRLAKFFGVPAE